MAMLSLRRGAWAEVLECADTALALCAELQSANGAPGPDAASLLAGLWIARATACSRLGRLGEALEAAERAERLAPEFLEPTAARVEALIDLGEAETALALLKSLPEAARRAAIMAALRERALFRAGRAEEGEAAMDDRAKSLPNWGAEVKLQSPVPELVNGDLKMILHGPTEGEVDGRLGWDYQPTPEVARLGGRFGPARVRGRLSLPVADTLREAVEAWRAGRLPYARVFLDGLLGLYPVAVALLVLLGWGEVERLAAWAPVVLLLALVSTILPVLALRQLYPPLRQGFHTAVYGLAAALVAGLFTQDSPGLAWPWWIVLVMGWLLSLEFRMRPAPHGELAPGEHHISARGRTKRVSLSDPALKLCIISAVAAEIEVDLTGCGIAESPVILDLDVWFSKVTLRIRPSWTVADIEDELLAIRHEKAIQPIYPPNDGMPPELGFRGIVLFSSIVYRY
jgi:tetratricopeptide (TPR) repeat protein